MEMECIVLEDGKEYAIVDTIDKNSNTYYYLTDTSDSKKFCIRKKIMVGDMMALTTLENDKEFDDALNYFTNEHADFLAQ